VVEGELKVEHAYMSALILSKQSVARAVGHGKTKVRYGFPAQQGVIESSGVELLGTRILCFRHCAGRSDDTGVYPCQEDSDKKLD